MGFKREQKTYKLIFEDPSLDGLEVVAKGLSVGELLNVNELDRNKETETTKELLKIVAEHIISWNLEHEDGSAVKPSYEALVAQDFEFTTAVLAAWLSAVASVSTNLEKTSSHSETMGSLPMETL